MNRALFMDKCGNIWIPQWKFVYLRENLIKAMWGGDYMCVNASTALYGNTSLYGNMLITGTALLH